MASWSYCVVRLSNRESEMVGASQEMTVAVCIATFQRPDGLQKLLRSLFDQPGVDQLEVIVVDNDPTGSARAIVDQYGATASHPFLTYVVEPEPGISAARNKGIQIARARGAFAVAFIDDDEFATPYWLWTMYQRLQTSGAAAVSGPVEPLFPKNAPGWVYSTRLYHRQTFPDGARLDQASTANSMVRLEALAGMVEPFSPEFGITGGSDTLLYRSIVARGGTIIWEPAGLVYEDVPESRLTLRWITLRGYRHGITLARCDLILCPTRRRLTYRGLRGLGQFPVGIAQIGLSLARRDQRWRNGLVRIARGAGVIAGLFGTTFNEYQRS
jgi:succinoglycan biosynthesis protein ExoM